MSQATTVRQDAGAILAGRHLLVIADGAVTTHGLPDAGDLILGRGEVDVVIEHPSISRRHARLAIGRALTIEDLGSANGTRVRDRRLTAGQPVAVDIGEAMELGSVIAIVHDGVARRRAHRTWTHGYFEARLEDECARADAAGGELAVLRVSCGSRHPPGFVEERLEGALRERDVLGLYAPGEYEVLCPATDAATAARVVQALEAELRRIGVVPRTGVACRPRDHRAPHALFALACAAARPPAEAPPSGVAIIVAPAMRRLYEEVERFAVTDMTVLVQGETGSGKELIADAIHRASPRARVPLVKVNAGAIPESLIESELFGHERGAFTNAVQAREGLIESADGGTLFLDEIAELPPGTQAKLLRVLEDRMVTRVGSNRPRKVDVRFVAATHHDLAAEATSGGFRADLYYRLAKATLRLPPLRERVEEIAPLARAFAREAALRLGRPEPHVTAGAIAVLERHPWPGNVRELRNAIERAVVLASDRIEAEHLSLQGASASSPTSPVLEAAAPPAAASTPLPAGSDAEQTRAAAGAELRRELLDVERQHIVEALARCGGNQTDAARLLGISRRTLSNKLDKLAITRPRKR